MCESMDTTVEFSTRRSEAVIGDWQALSRISHDDTAEIYVFISGNATLITGAHVFVELKNPASSDHEV